MVRKPRVLALKTGITYNCSQIATMKVVVDVDAGIDDALALMMLLGSKEIEIVAITTVAGNSCVANVTQNVLRVLDAAKRLDIPVYEGCNTSLLGQTSPGYAHHGSNGFGDNPNMKTVDRKTVSKEHAVMGLIQQSKKYENDLTLIAIGPLTNIAMTLRMDPEFGKRLKSCFIMGGSSICHGNMTANAEFNFWFDPEAAHVSINELQCPITIIGWEVGLACAWPWKEFQNKFLVKDSQCVQLIRDAEWNFQNRVVNKDRTVICDAVCIAALLQPDLVRERSVMPGRVSLSGEARGSLMIDRRRQSEKWTRLDVVLDVNVQAFKDLMADLIYRCP